MLNAKEKLLTLLTDMTAKDPLAKHTKAFAYGLGLFLLFSWCYVLTTSGLFPSLLLGATFVIFLYLQVNRYANKLIRLPKSTKPRIEDARLLIVSSKAMTLFSAGAFFTYVMAIFTS
ncbi:hypothetical protein [Piscirickettsia salmonis]|uniref:hypothetical protein n=1 Tax=Piscirickettsia salmonis TaxID=1238 RepID=UPI000332C81A|nr:hypothetical protein [Piscirickettsia salmonis]APS59085.1 hypothetical protein AVI52_17785 [Piscirickettsia salmonis]ERL61385.1 putative membrane protein [Piscirickettsia salmonis LF-89 = ATCC VR-1361]PEQ16279.1 hypothetical protein X973_08265 [Piscirickettsia salmonis]QGN79239.1 hypothetical protein Psal001_03504 [Piscirickettsia salmonis]QGN82830.1 hypothetical protein Psal002_03530 [Piscirickettsia salmonis]